MTFPARFTRYEIFRILIPGYVATILLLIWIYTTPIRNFITLVLINSNLFLTTFLSGGIIIGLFIYSYDHPIKTSFYKKNNEYDILGKYLIELLCHNCEEVCENIINDENVEESYFYLQYSLIDTTSQGVIQYFRSVYRVYSNIRFLLECATVLELLTIFITFLYAILLAPLGTKGLYFEDVIIQTVYIIIICLILFLINNDNKGEKYLGKAISFQKNYFKIEKDNIIKKICKQDKS